MFFFYIQKSCELCPNEGGVFKITNDFKFVHVICALSIPGILFGNDLTIKPVILSSISSECFGRECFHCKYSNRRVSMRMGALLKCSYSKCKRYFHVTCAQLKGINLI